MTTIISPVAKIENLNISPFPSKRVLKDLAVVRVGSHIIGADAKGRVYSTQVEGCVAYSITCNLQNTINGLLMLGVISKKDHKAHMDAQALAQAKRSRGHAAEMLEWAAKELGTRLTNAQKGAIERAQKERS